MGSPSPVSASPASPGGTPPSFLADVTYGAIIGAVVGGLVGDVPGVFVGLYLGQAAGMAVYFSDTASGPTSENDAGDDDQEVAGEDQEPADEGEDADV
jgi:hypothetical protein